MKKSIVLKILNGNSKPEQKETSSKDNPETPVEDSKTFSKPPGFEAFNSNNSNNSCIRKSFPRHNQSSHCSSAPVKSSHINNSHTNPLSKHGSMIEALVKSIWGNSQFEFAECPSIGTSGGLVSMWDSNAFSKNKVFQFDNFIVVEGTWIASHIHFFMINVYAPQDVKKKAILWNEIHDFMSTNKGMHIIFGDFNEVRFPSERIASDTFVPHLQNVSGLVLDCHISDHRPILLEPITTDFGPTPFKFYNSWLLDKNLHSCVNEFWTSYNSCNIMNPIIHFKNKMKALKIVIKDWSANRRHALNHENEEIMRNIKSFDASISSKSSNFVADYQRSSWIDRLRQIEVNESIDSNQKGKVKWCAEADENSKFFHAIVNQRRRYLAIQGIKVDGHWIVDPPRIKDAFISFFEKKFKHMEVIKVVNRSPFYKSLTNDQSSFLDSPISSNEIKAAIWDCGSDKSPGLDGFTFAFYKEFWNTIKDDVVTFVHHFFATGSLPRGCNNSFITLIPKVPNPMVASDFRPISLIGAQYKIIAKVLANRLACVIDTIISHEQSAFIKNRQILDGPLMVNEVLEFMGFSDINGLSGFQVSGLKINYHKSKLFGVGVSPNEISALAATTGCSPLASSFNYLGLPVDCNMSRVKSWDPIVEKFSSRLSRWRASLLSFGGRATLISSGGTDSSHKVHWIRWKDVLASKDKGGLGIGSLYALNQALILKWRWRFLTNPHALWARLITAIYGHNKDPTSFFSHIKSKGVWSRIVGSINHLHEKNYIQSSLSKRSLQQKIARFVRIGKTVWNLALGFRKSYPSYNASHLVMSPEYARCQIDGEFLPDQGHSTRWNQIIPKKVNIFVWRASRDRLPSRWNLSRRGIEVNSLNCPICDTGTETSFHTLWACSFASLVWIRVFKWVDLFIPSILSLSDLFIWIDDSTLPDGSLQDVIRIPSHGTTGFKTL
ncbi:RNA-directed DNA polymerase, eukaryota [Tanacetum coccineum]